MAITMFLYLEGIKGECEEENHKKWIEISGWSHGAEMPSTDRRTSTGPSVERCNLNPISFSKSIDRSSMTLMSYLWKGKEIKKGKIECFRAHGDNAPVDYVVVEMEGLFLNSHGIGGEEGDILKEDYSMTYGVIQYKYKVQEHLTGNVVKNVSSDKVDLVKGTFE